MKLKKQSNKLKKKDYTEDIYQNQFKDCLKELEDTLRVRNSERERSLWEKSLELEDALKVRNSERETNLWKNSLELDNQFHKISLNFKLQ